MSTRPARRTLAWIILVASVMPDSSQENSPETPGWCCRCCRTMCCCTVRIGRSRASRFVSGEFMGAFLQGAEFNVLVPHLVAVVLEAEVSLARQVLDRHAELVLRAVGAQARFVELVTVQRGHFLAVDHDLDLRTLAGGLDRVPL